MNLEFVKIVSQAFYKKMLIKKKVAFATFFFIIKMT